jgi:hypothetical protein
MLVVATRRPMRTMPPLTKIFASALLLAASASAATVSGRLTDPQGKAIAQASIRLGTPAAARRETLTDDDGRFSFASIVSGSYTLEARQAGFADLKQTVRVHDDLQLDLRLELPAISQVLNVTAHLDHVETDVLFPDPAQRLIIREETLDANPGRPGVPVSPSPASPPKPPPVASKPRNTLRPAWPETMASPSRNTSKSAII